MISFVYFDITGVLIQTHLSVIPFSPNQALWPIIISLSTQTKLGLITNLTATFVDNLIRSQALPPITWQIIINASSTPFSKTDPQIYFFAINQTHVAAANILFIDNTQANLDAAASLGIQTFFYDSRQYPQSTNQLAQHLRQKGFTV